ncbi:ESX secretion-associated protein EspG [Actinokineospora sp.]|uniref:ESX secretion-associated protein EspG n=1 Tax=Actinokineospora sp. TaxID=1872133 RepID=UPI003D6B9C5D
MRPLADLSPVAFDVLWTDLKLGMVPFPLEIQSVTLDERARIRAAVHADLRGRGVFHNGRPSPALEEALRLLSRPAVSISLMTLHDDTPDRPSGALVAAAGRQAVLAVQRERSISLAEVRDTAMVGSIVDLLPPNRPGPGRSVTVPAPAAVGGHDAQPQGYTRTMTAQGQHQAEMRQLSAVMERPIQRAGMINLTVRDTQSGAPSGLTWIDNDQGRYTLSGKIGPDGRIWTTLTPADNPRLATRLADLLSAATRT